MKSGFISSSAIKTIAVVFATAAVLLSACAGTNPAAQPATTQAASTAVDATAASSKTAAESPVAPETNPVGDIPDSQVFITYAGSPGTYSLEVPEGWARSTSSTDVRFVDKFDGVSVTLKPAANAPDAASAKQNEIPALLQSERAFQVGEVTDVSLPGGQAVRITASANSDPDPVTNKQVRLEEEIYLFYNKGTVAMVKLWAPQGADNVDQWKRMIESFHWN